MQLTFEVNGQNYQFDTSTGQSLAISLDFDGPQVNHFGVPKAVATSLEMGGFIGDTTRGGSCNVKTIELIPHCHGTHTESVSHIVDQLICPSDLVSELMPATLISITPEVAEQIEEHYLPALEATDQVITKKALEQALADIDQAWLRALIIRTLPNDPSKARNHYSDALQPPFFTIDAIQLIKSLGVKHLLVDFPSLDKQYDEGLLTNHHRFWDVPDKGHQLTDNTAQMQTVTELIYVAADVADGQYILNLQLIDFQLDAVPSRPILYPIRQCE